MNDKIRDLLDLCAPSDDERQTRSSYYGYPQDQLPDELQQALDDALGEELVTICHDSGYPAIRLTERGKVRWENKAKREPNLVVLFPNAKTVLLDPNSTADDRLRAITRDYPQVMRLVTDDVLKSDDLGEATGHTGANIRRGRWWNEDLVNWQQKQARETPR